MDAIGKNLALAVLVSAPLLAACTQSPETTFEWGVNDHLPSHHYARNEVTRSDLPATYVYQGSAYAVPAPKPRPNYQPRTSQSPSYQSPSYQSPSEPRSQSDYAGNGPNFFWPVSGNVISNFGAASNGERNDGINIAAPVGTPIHAAASGTITYAGNELKDYGNLVLIKHDGGYVTAYAHADKLIVSRGDVVSRGQVIGYSGNTGDVSSPQLHFEIRHDTQPVNPRPLLMARNS
jgi:murein DD-endopeptidase MepM/ murein hydrolase activator NlpD